MTCWQYSFFTAYADQWCVFVKSFFPHIPKFGELCNRFCLLSLGLVARMGTLFGWWALLVALLTVCGISTATGELIPIDLSIFGSTLYRLIDTSVDPLVRNHDPWSSGIEPWELGNLVGGDMRLPRPRFRHALAGPPDAAYRWPNATVIYSIDGTFNSSELKFINGAMREFERHTCVRFRRRRPEDVAYVSIDNIEPGCWSDVGRGVERTVVNLQPGCANALTTPVHELMHTLGFYHEHNRLDRDRYVTILYENMLPDESLRSNFDLVDPGNTTTFNVPYDLGSIMHYRKDAFSKRPSELDTMHARVQWEGELGQQNTLTWYDALLINIMYCGVPVPREPLPIPSRWIPAKAYGRRDRFRYQRVMRTVGAN